MLYKEDKNTEGEGRKDALEKSNLDMWIVILGGRKQTHFFGDCKLNSNNKECIWKCNASVSEGALVISNTYKNNNWLKTK